MGPISTRGLGFTLGFFLGLSFLVKGPVRFVFLAKLCADYLCSGNGISRFGISHTYSGHLFCYWLYVFPGH